MLRVPAAAVLAALLTTQTAQARPWLLRDAASFTFISDLQLAPDGAHAIVGVQRIDVAAMTFSAEEDVLDMASGQVRPLLRNPRIPIDRARWSPDGSRVAFLSHTKNGAQLDVVAVPGGEPRVVLKLTQDVIGYAWSPDGTRIAAVQAQPSARAVQAGPSMWVNPDVTIAAGNLPAQRTLWLIDVAKGTERRIVRDTYSYGGPATDHDPSWSADGRSIAVVRQPTPFYAAFERAQYVSVDVASGAVRSLLDAPFFAYPESAPPQYAPAGKSVALVHTWDGRLASREDLYVDGNDLSASLDRDVWSCGGSQIAWNGRHVIASALDGVSMRLFELSPGAAPRALTPLDGSVLLYSVSRNGRIALAYSTPEKLVEVYALENGALRRVTHLNRLPEGVDVAKTTLLTWSDGRGHTLGGQLTLPANPKGAPVIVEPHGGPQCSDDNEFDALAQYFATNGYVYFRPNPAGSDGYGDWSYKAIVGNWGERPMSDDMTGVDTLLRDGYGDPSKLFIEGGSYGGYLTSWIVTHTNRFRAAVAAVPVTDLRLDYTLSESPNITKRFFGMHPIAENQDLMRRESPVEYASQMNTPLLIISGLQDTRAPYPQALEFYKALLDAGKDVRMLVYPQAGHGPNDPAGIVDFERHILGWLQAHGGPALPGAILPP